MEGKMEAFYVLASWFMIAWVAVELKVWYKKLKGE